MLQPCLMGLATPLVCLGCRGPLPCLKHSADSLMRSDPAWQGCVLGVWTPTCDTCSEWFKRPDLYSFMIRLLWALVSLLTA